MTLKTFIVEPISKAQITSFTERKHYSKSVGVVTKAFALVHNNIIEGIITYRPPSRPIEQYAFKDRDFPIYELARLVVQTSVPNAASYFISKTLGLLEPHCAIVSYADTEWSHVGIVYQATNWIYTGKTKANDNSYMINGKKVHPRTLGIRDNSLSLSGRKRWDMKPSIHHSSTDISSSKGLTSKRNG